MKIPKRIIIATEKWDNHPRGTVWYLTFEKVSYGDIVYRPKMDYSPILEEKDIAKKCAFYFRDLEKSLKEGYVVSF